VFSSEITIYEESLASITVLVIKMTGRLVGQKNLRIQRKIKKRVDMENIIESVMAAATHLLPYDPVAKKRLSGSKGGSGLCN
jgi:hypothetical protein